MWNGLRMFHKTRLHGSQRQKDTTAIAHAHLPTVKVVPRPTMFLVVQKQITNWFGHKKNNISNSSGSLLFPLQQNYSYAVKSSLSPASKPIKVIKVVSAHAMGHKTGHSRGWFPKPPVSNATFPLLLWKKSHKWKCSRWDKRQPWPVS